MQFQFPSDSDLRTPADSAQTRRAFLKTLSAASAATLTFGAPRLLQANTPGAPAPKATADRCILLWMGGGMAAPDTFDPKHYEPFQKGLPIEKVSSTFPAIDTVIPGVQITEGLEKVAKILDRGTLIRSHVVADLGNILHSRHQFHWHTGYVPPQTVAAPHIGAWMARVLGPDNPAIPPFICIGQRMEGNGEKEELKAFHTGGFLGSEYGPFMLPDADLAIEAVRPPKGMSPNRFASRYSAYQKMVNSGPNKDLVSDYHRESMLRSVENAHRLLNSPDRAAFDLSLEPKESYDRYNTGRFGQGCLLARRLAEAGSRFVEVSTEYIPFVHWDTHENGHETYARMKKEIDQPIAQLILDLEAKGLLDRTLVVLATEFSRDMMIEGVPGSTAKDQSRAKSDTLEESKHYGLHRHFTGGCSALMFGGGIKKGHVYGSTADERPFLAVKDPLSISDLHASIFAAMGISPAYGLDIEKRPFYVTDNGMGKVAQGLFEHSPV